MQIFRLDTAHIKIYQICHVRFCNQEPVLFSNFASLINVMLDNSSVLFHLKFYMLSTKGAHQGANFQLAWKLIKFLVIFQATSQFSFKFCITFQCHDTKFLWNFLAELLSFGQKEPMKVQILRLLCALMKVHPILHASFETARWRFIQILDHYAVSVTPLHFFSLNL